MSVETRFLFAGPAGPFVAKENRDFAGYVCDIGTIVDGGITFVLSAIRNAAFPNLNFLISSVSSPEGKELWNFKQTGFDGLGLLAKAGELVVIALTARGREGKVERVIPLKTLVNKSPVGIKALFHLKREAAAFLNRDYARTADEELVLKVELAREKAIRDAAMLASKEANDLARIERLKKIALRGKITAYTAEGRARTGIPVLESEWQGLSDNTYVVLVESIGPDGSIGKPIESFKVTKVRGMNPKKDFLAKVTSKQPQTVAAAQVAVINPLRTVVIERDEDAYPVLVFRSMDEIKAARAAGLNGGTFAAVDSTAKTLEVYAVHHDGVKTIGKFAPIV